MRTKSLQIGRRMGQDRPGFLGISPSHRHARRERLTRTSPLCRDQRIAFHLSLLLDVFPGRCRLLARRVFFFFSLRLSSYRARSSAGSAKNISRIHSEIRYIPHGRPNTAGYWQMTCVGKNGMQCNEDYMAPRENFKIKHKDRLQVGETAFFFLEPTPMSRTQTRE